MNAKEKVDKLYSEKRKAYCNEYYRKNRERILKKRREAYVNDPEKFKERNHYNYQKRKAAKNERGQ